MWNKWKNHFSEMKGDVGMSHHEKEGNKKMPIPRQEVIDNPIPTSLFSIKLSVHIYMFLCVLKLHPQYLHTTEQLHRAVGRTWRVGRPKN